MVMNAKQVQQYVLRYLDATNCHLIEKSPGHVIVKLSPQADRELTNRPYYWGFVDRTGTEPETMKFCFIFDKDKMPPLPPDPPPGPGYIAHRLLKEEVTYGSRRLDQFFLAAKAGGSYVNLFELPTAEQKFSNFSTPYEPWLGVNMKIEFACDMKREEIHSLGISMVTGEIIEHFCDDMLSRKMTPRLPANVHILRSALTLTKARNQLENYIDKKLKTYDDEWAVEARIRFDDEIARIDSYYDGLLKTEDEEVRKSVEEQYANRKQELTWQYEPRIRISVMNCGFFHLRSAAKQ